METLCVWELPLTREPARNATQLSASEDLALLGYRISGANRDFSMPDPGCFARSIRAMERGRATRIAPASDEDTPFGGLQRRCAEVRSAEGLIRVLPLIGSC